MVNHPHRSRRTATATATASVRRERIEHDHERDYAAFRVAVEQVFHRAPTSPLFTTDVPEGGKLNELYLSLLGDERQLHNCTACRHFIERFGGLVTIDEHGHAASALWDANTVPVFYRPAVVALADVAENVRVTGVFLSGTVTLGTPHTGVWSHLSVVGAPRYRNALLSAGQAMAAKREDFANVARALADFSAETIAEAIRLLETGHLRSPEKFIAPLQWLAELHAKRSQTRDSRRRDNILWRAVATAPDGFCHPRAAVTGTLLEDIAAGLPFADIQARFASKLHPLQYQRPQAAPAAGNIAQAERVVEKLGIAPALRRRFARLEEVSVAWRPAARRAPPERGGVFGHLDPKGANASAQVNAPATTMTWEKFLRTVLPGAEKIEALISGGRMPFIAMTTAVDPEAPPILKWDLPLQRNPIAWYVYHGGTMASQWRLSPGWVTVTGIAALPPMCGDKPQPHLGEGFILVLEGCADTRTGQGNALFPECLIGDLHGVRSTIEAYSRKAELEGRDEASACGLDIRKGMQSIGYRLRVTMDGRSTEYLIDRWD